MRIRNAKHRNVMGRESRNEALCTVWCKWRIWDFHPLAPNVTHFNCIVACVDMLHEMLFQTKAVAVSMTLVLKFMCVRTGNFWSEQCEWCKCYGFSTGDGCKLFFPEYRYLPPTKKKVLYISFHGGSYSSDGLLGFYAM